MWESFQIQEVIVKVRIMPKGNRSFILCQNQSGQTLASKHTVTKGVIEQRTETNVILIN